jgi:hypothetical protein
MLRPRVECRTRVADTLGVFVCVKVVDFSVLRDTAMAVARGMVGVEQGNSAVGCSGRSPRTRRNVATAFVSADVPLIFVTFRQCSYQKRGRTCHRCVSPIPADRVGARSTLNAHVA